MRQYRLRSIMALIGVIALSLWAGMQIERARRPPRAVYTVMRPVKQTRSYTVMRPVKQTRSYTVMRPVRQKAPDPPSPD